MKPKHPILLLCLAAVMAAFTAGIASAATTTTTTRVTWGMTGWTCAVKAVAPAPSGTGFGVRHSDGFVSCLDGAARVPVAHISLTTCLQTSVDGRTWKSAWCRSGVNDIGAASADANLTEFCGAGYHQVRTQVKATAIQPSLKLVAKSASATSAVVGCRG